jgi:serine/threonine protein kinase
MSPEQMASARDVDHRADIWALGTILHETLTGDAPFSGRTLPEICFKIATEPPTSLRSHRADAPAQLEAVILRCLEKNRANRYRNVGELAMALADFAPPRARTLVERITLTIQHAGLAGSPETPPSVQEGRSSGTMAPLGTTAAIGKRPTALAPIITSALLAALAGGIFFFVRSSGTPKIGQTSTMSAGSAATSAESVEPLAATAATAPGSSIVESPPAPSAPGTVPEVAAEPPPDRPVVERQPQPLAPHKPGSGLSQNSRPPPRRVDAPSPSASPPRSARPALAKPADDLGGRL